VIHYSTELRSTRGIDVQIERSLRRSPIPELHPCCDREGKSYAVVTIHIYVSVCVLNIQSYGNHTIRARIRLENTSQVSLCACCQRSFPLRSLPPVEPVKGFTYKNTCPKHTKSIPHLSGIPFNEFVDSETCRQLTPPYCPACPQGYV